MIANFPKKLYKYRNFSDNHINALEKLEFWGATASMMKDDRECGIYCDYSEYVNFAHKKIKEEYIDDLYIKMIGFFDDYFRSFKFIVSLCDSNDDFQMWDEYSDKHTGFVLEYETGDILKKLNLVLDNIYLNLNFSSAIEKPDQARNFLREHDIGLYPVRYENNETDLTKMIIDELYNQYEEKVKGVYFSWDKDESHYIKQSEMITRIVTTKKSKYSYEKEWRIVVPSFHTEFKKEAKSLFFVKPTKLILGRHINNNNKERILKIAEMHNIIIQQM